MAKIAYATAGRIGIGIQAAYSYQSLVTVNTKQEFTRTLKAVRACNPVVLQTSH
ncbi:hypothetical protein [Novosphingobium sp. PhB165]|uniref:hypothetical protein n=1 Tax=Novosphingobium sp. PhB165 TaxID=2485105 RepID=UPI0014056148|nr:hypothetical protein [Novosphingobium sp. PhB165]